MLAVTVKRCGPTPIPVHGTYHPRKRHPSRRAERQNPYSGSTVALRGFVQDGFCNGFPRRDHAAIVLAISHHRNINILRPIRYADGPRPRRELFQRQDYRTGRRIGDTETGAEVLERIAERIEGGDHIWPRLDARVHVLPFGDDAVGTVTGLNDVGGQ